MSNVPSEVLDRQESRRSFTVAEKLAIVAETRQPGVRFVDIARRHKLRPGQLYKWRRLVELGVIGIPGASELPSFVAIEMRDDRGLAGKPMPDVQRRTVPSPLRGLGLIDIDIGDGRCVRVDAHVDAEALARVLAVLDRR
jgi:transposase